MNKHDNRRRVGLINTLARAKEQAEIALLYLTANNGDPEKISSTALAYEHIEIALEHLGAAEEKIAT